MQNDLKYCIITITNRKAFGFYSMAVRLNTKYASDVVTCDKLKAISGEVNAAVKTLRDGSGAGNDFIGWVDLPVNYDKEEFSRIKIAAEKIKKSCDVFIAIGIGGSYLGARAAIEFCQSPF